LIELVLAIGPPMFLGGLGATGVSIVSFWIVFYVWIGSEFWFAYRYRRLPSGAATHDAGSRYWLISSVWASVAIAIGTAFGLPGAAIRTGRIDVFVLGLVLMVAGLALRWYSIRVLGISFTIDVATRPGQQVVESGPYRWIRHPSYTGALLTILGVILCCVNVASLAALSRLRTPDQETDSLLALGAMDRHGRVIRVRRARRRRNSPTPGFAPPLQC
jgi:protein-S-isoprenylcysteine O-methyltransferase